MKNLIQTASEVKNSSPTHTLAHETRKNKQGGAMETETISKNEQSSKSPIDYSIKPTFANKKQTKPLKLNEIFKLLNKFYEENNLIARVLIDRVEEPYFAHKEKHFARKEKVFAHEEKYFVHKEKRFAHREKTICAPRKSFCARAKSIGKHLKNE